MGLVMCLDNSGNICNCWYWSRQPFCSSSDHSHHSAFSPSFTRHVRRSGSWNERYYYVNAQDVVGRTRFLFLYVRFVWECFVRFYPNSERARSLIRTLSLFPFIHAHSHSSLSARHDKKKRERKIRKLKFVLGHRPCCWCASIRQ